MAEVGYIHNVAEDGSGLFVTSLPTETIVHRYDPTTTCISVPAFGGLSGNEPNVENIRAANLAYKRWLDDIAASPANSLNLYSPTPVREERHQTDGGTVESRYIVQVDGSPVRLLRATWNPATFDYELRQHGGRVAPYSAALEWNLATRRFIDNVLHWA